ncbi:hypothetical protein [Desulfosporosinus sp. FKA]|uniref:hypothetical protein n=1 Tax=Desulfosporosinus sp. FKA TaxID=1969834 RepID=UPI000B4A30F6|nr:hypothetical protein [Desulfosporosinus sp. FKA]
MFKFRPRRILAILGILVIVGGGYAAWQVHSGLQLANQYEADAQKLAQASNQSPRSTNTQAPGSQGISSGSPLNPGLAGQSTSNNSEPSQASSGSANSSTPQSPSSASSPQDYKQFMKNTYQQTLGTMQNVKNETLSLESRRLSLAAYRSSILQSQAAFSAAESFVQANPPQDEKLNATYQRFLAGISLAKQSMNVVLNGISTFNPSNLYAAREMGKKAQQEVISGYAEL